MTLAGRSLNLENDSQTNMENGLCLDSTHSISSLLVWCELLSDGSTKPFGILRYFAIISWNLCVFQNEPSSMKLKSSFNRKMRYDQLRPPCCSLDTTPSPRYALSDQLSSSTFSSVTSQIVLKRIFSRPN